MLFFFDLTDAAVTTEAAVGGAELIGTKPPNGIGLMADEDEAATGATTTPDDVVAEGFIICGGGVTSANAAATCDLCNAGIELELVGYTGG